MNKIILISDTLCDLTPELYREYNIITLPLSISFKDDPKLYFDGQDITPEMIYNHVKEKNVLPTTGAIPPETYIEAFKKQIDAGNDVLFIGAGSGISSSYQNAVLASKEFPEERIVCIDSQSLSTGIALLVLKGRLLIDEGKTLNEISATINELVEHLSVKFSVDSMEYLYRGGRCKGLAYIFGSSLRIHPIIKVTGNKLVVAKKPRGNYSKALDQQIEEFMNDLPNIDMEHVFITHSGPSDFDGWQYIKERIEKYVPEGHLHITTAGATVTSHCGPHTIGILYLLK